jgi:phage terminase small subunit
MPLTDKEEKFCQEYVKSLNKTRAAKWAGYSSHTAKEIGYENFTKPHIQQRIKEIREEFKQKLGIDEYSVLAELASLAFANIRDFIGSENKIKDLSKIRKEKLKAVASIKVTETKSTLEGVDAKKVTTELKLINKRDALLDLGKHLGIFSEDHRLKIDTPADSHNLSDEQFKQLLATIIENHTNRNE